MRSGHFPVFIRIMRHHENQNYSQPEKPLLVFTLWSAAACAQSAKTPNTPTGTALQVWLEAFNSGDKVRLHTYFSTYKNGPATSVDGTLAFRD